jgi:hypothetical protein
MGIKNQHWQPPISMAAGAYSGRYEFGGLSLENLDVTDGASDVNVNFSEPNPSDMKKFSYNTGASNVTLEGLGNANFETMVFKGGAGSYRLVYDGEIKQDAVVNIGSGISTVTIVVPKAYQPRLHWLDERPGFLGMDPVGDRILWRHGPK